MTLSLALLICFVSWLSLYDAVLGCTCLLGATLSDGEFTILVVRENFSRWDMARLLLALDSSGSHFQHPKAEVYRVRAYRLEPLCSEGRSVSVELCGLPVSRVLVFISLSCVLTDSLLFHCLVYTSFTLIWSLSLSLSLYIFLCVCVCPRIVHSGWREH